MPPAAAYLTAQKRFARINLVPDSNLQRSRLMHLVVMNGMPAVVDWACHRDDALFALLSI
jgi:hypothetical protein